MTEFKCPLCKQTVSEELFERITGIWKERRAAEKRFKEQEKDLVRQKKEGQKQLETEKRRLKSEQKNIIEQKLIEKTKKYDESFLFCLFTDLFCCSSYIDFFLLCS